MPQRSCDVESLQDFSRYYNGGWVGFYNKDGTVGPASVGRDGANHVNLRVLGVVGENRYQAIADHDLSFKELKESIDFGRPEIGMMEDGPTIVYLSYHTPRQAHKGFRTRELAVDEFNNNDLRDMHIPERPARGGERHDWVWKAFNPSYTPFAAAFDQLQQGKRVGVPVSTRIGLYLYPDSVCPVVAYKRWTVGYAPDPKSLRIYRKFMDYSEDLTAQTGAEVQLI